MNEDITQETKVDGDNDVPEEPPKRMVITQMKHPDPPLEGEQREAMETARKNIETRAARGGYTDLKWETIDGAKHPLDRLTGVKP